MKRNENTDLVIPSVAALDRAMRQKYTIVRALEAALSTCVTYEAIPPTVVWQALEEVCAKTLATVVTQVRQERDDQVATIEDAIKDVGYNTYCWLLQLRGELPQD
jgi:hypothetical protein